MAEKLKHSVEHTCDECGEHFVIRYTSKQDIQFCPFCGEETYIPEEPTDCDEEDEFEGYSTEDEEE